MKMFGAAVIVAALSSSPSLAQRQTVCLSLESLKQQLSDGYHELEIGGGWLNEATALTVFVSPGGETWTIARLSIDGSACVVMTGRGWFHGVVPAVGQVPS